VSIWPSRNHKILHNRLRDRRTERGLTQEALGEAVGLTRQSIIAIEKGRFTPTVYTALTLASALGVPVDDLFWIDSREGKEEP
jgi:putative transcriptional regulator